MESSDKGAVGTEQWGTAFTLSMVVAVSIPLVIGPITLYAAGDTISAGILATASWFLVSFYESPMMPQLKNEVRKLVA